MSASEDKMASGTNPRAKGPILIVDDDGDDAALAKRAVRRLYPDFPIEVFGSGQALLNYLEGETTSSKRTGREVSSMILLDLGMPEMDGFAVLERLKEHPQFGSIPVVVTSIFEDLPHLRRAYKLLARAYLLKPIHLESLRDAVSALNLDI
jgi:CheY-like chemotaxis protein